MKKFSLLILVVFCVSVIWAQNGIPLIGEEAPSFKANTTNGKLNFPKDFGSKWKILLSHPKDFTPVCTSELMQLAEMQEEFSDLGVELAIISTDGVQSHVTWIQAMEEIVREGKEQINIEFPLIGDEEAKVSRLYGMLHEPVSTVKDVRGVFIIDDENIIQSVNFYPMNVGRNMDEIKRVVTALKTSKEEMVLMPVNWNVGDDVLMKFRPYVDSELLTNPDLKNQYYNVGNNMWFKKMKD
jgi:peroxiredoxin (alkyl hydroperoxide reductase subunit C)